MITATFPALVQRFFTERLLQQRHVSPHTIASYRDAFRLLLRFASARRGTSPSALRTDDLDRLSSAPFLTTSKGPAAIVLGPAIPA